MSLEIARHRHDIGCMITRILTSAVVALVLAGGPAAAQIFPQGGAVLLPPPPPAPPPPPITIPVVPKLGDMPSQPNAARAPRSFGDRITDCLQDGASAGLNSSDRAAYSRSCANR